MFVMREHRDPKLVDVIHQLYLQSLQTAVLKSHGIHSSVITYDQQAA